MSQPALRQRQENRSDSLELSLGLAAASSFMGSIAASNSMKVQKYQSETQAKIAKLNGKATALNLTNDFNKSMASDAVMAAAQGRSGGSVAGIARAAEAQYNWDVDFAELSAKIQESGYTAQAAQYGMGARQTLLGGALGAVGGAATTYYDTMGKIGGSTRPKTTGFTTYEGGATWG